MRLTKILPKGSDPKRLALVMMLASARMVQARHEDILPEDAHRHLSKRALEDVNLVQGFINVVDPSTFIPFLGIVFTNLWSTLLGHSILGYGYHYMVDHGSPEVSDYLQRNFDVVLNGKALSAHLGRLIRNAFSVEAAKKSLQDAVEENLKPRIPGQMIWRALVEGTSSTLGFAVNAGIGQLLGFQDGTKKKRK